MNVTHIEVYGIIITEPFTWLTNWIVAGFSFYFSHMLFYSKTADKQAKYWAMFFVTIAVASITGGTAHGFINYVGINFHYAAWILTGIAVFLAQLAALEIVANAKIFRIARILVALQLIGMCTSVILFQNFEAVRINSAFGLIGVVLPIQIYAYKTLSIKRNGIIALGILSNIAPGIIHATKFSYNRWFNFNDISHVVMIGCFYILYLGAKKTAIKNTILTNPTSV